MKGTRLLETGVLNDVPYVNLITECINKVKQTKANNLSEWWELLLFNVRNHTRWYTEQKKYRETVLKTSLTSQLDYLETLPLKGLPSHLVERLTYVKQQLAIF